MKDKRRQEKKTNYSPPNSVHIERILTHAYASCPNICDWFIQHTLVYLLSLDSQSLE